MDFTIYTTGSAEYLQIMLNAVAMITGAGTAEDLARVGAILGVLLLAFQAAFNNQAITFQKAGLVLVLYMMFYGPTATAVIEDTVSGQVRIVDNVPLGPVFVGSLISTVSYEITRVSEQGFSTPGMTDYGLFSPLTTLTKVRDSLRNPMSLDKFNNYGAASGASLPKTVTEYLTFCTLNPSALRNEKSIDELYRTSGIASLLSNASTSQFIYVYDGSAGFGVGALKSCSAAKSWISTSLSAVYLDVMQDLLDKGFSDEKASGRLATASDVDLKVGDAIQSFAISGKASQEYVMTSLIAPMFNDARVQALEHWQEKRAALALRESLNQQNIQWAGKGETFKHYMRPMIAFFEGLLYAMTPFMAFALLLGGPGLSILGKYLVLPLAVGMWMPLLSIVNAFTLWYANAEIEGVLNAYDPTSTGFAMLQVMDMDQAISKALGIGGLLAASVPPLALFIVSGSAMVANSIMSQATAADKFKSEDVNPRTQQPSPVLSTSSMYTSDQLTQGVNRTGATQVAEQISAQQAASALVQSTESNSIAATESYQKSLASAVERSATTTEGRQNLANLGRQVGAGLNLSSNSQYTDAASTLSSLGYSSDQIAAGTFAASVGASAPFGAAGVKLEESQQFKQMNSAQQQQARQAMQQLTNAVQASSSDQTLFQSGEAFTTGSQSAISQKATESLNQQLTEAKTAQLAYQKASSMQDVFAAGQSMDLKQAAGASLGRGLGRAETAQALAEMAGSTESGRAAFTAAMNSESIGSLSSDREERIAMSAIRALNQDGRLGELINSGMSPFDFNVNAGDAGRNAGLADSSPDTSGLRSQVQGAYGSAAGAYDSERDMNLSGYEGLKQDGTLVVDGANSDAQVRVSEAQDHERARLEAATAPLPQADVTVQSSSPVSDGFKGLLRPDASNTLVVGAKQIAAPLESAAGEVKEWIESKRRPNLNE
ncbi:hypothetical protein AX279_13365 [Pseudomonas sp. J237]|nr:MULTISPECIES: conjugal transfer protein TraG N-terminal domain-containing protein [Pseudomonas]OEO25076.1 hypothetical protein AX279_13365 [Pseudomonas sp. J237]